MAQPRTQPRRKIVAIMAADVAGYSRLMGRDEEGTYTALRAHLDDLFIPGIEEFEGRIIKFIGDGVLAEFPSAVDALNCAAKIQAEMAMRNREVPSDRQLNFRIGLHVGDVMEADGDLFGDGVNTAARVEGTATPGGINVSRFVYESVRKKVPLEFEDLGDHMFKSFEEPVQVYRVSGFLRPRTELRLGEARERIAPGTRLNSIYEVDQLIAVGATSEVYRARSVQTGDPVVIKALPPRLTQSPEAIASVRAQASALYKLHHEAIAHTMLFSVDEAVGQPYLAMEAVDGISLFDRVRHTPLTVDEADTLRRRLASALAEAHASGVVHGAITPDNIVIPEGDVAHSKIIDFSITGLRPESERTVISTGLEPKNLFQAPEQIGHFGGTVGPEADVYSLGLVLGFAVNGRPLDAHATFAELVEGRKKRPDLASLPAGIRPLLFAMLTPDPTNRHITMANIAAWDGKEPIEALAPSGSDASPSETDGSRSRSRFLVAASVAGLALVGAGAWFALTGDDTNTVTDNAPTTPQVTALNRPSGADETTGDDPASPTPSATTQTVNGATTEGASTEGASTGDTTPPEPAPTVAKPVTAEFANPAATDEPTENTPPQTPPALPAQPPATEDNGGAGPDGLVRLASLSGRDGMDGSVRGIVSAVDTVNSGSCFFASVVSAKATSLDVDMYADDADQIYDAYNAIKEAIAFDPTVTGRLISDNQCIGLEFAQLGGATSAMSLDLKTREIEPGSALEGTIGDIPTGRLLLLAIDPRGTVYDLTDSLEGDPAGSRFRLSVNHPTRGSVTSLLIAISVPEGATTPTLESGTLARDYLPELAKGLAASDSPVAIRMDHFVLKS